MADDVLSQASVDASLAARPKWTPAPGSGGQGTEEAQRDRNKTAAAAGTKPLTMRHKGGPILKTGPYRLKKGEHVLAPNETKKVKAMVSGLKSMSKTSKTK